MIFDINNNKLLLYIFLLNFCARSFFYFHLNSQNLNMSSFVLLDLLEPYGISFGDKVYEGSVHIGEHPALEFASGTSLTRFPKSPENFLVFAQLRDQGHAFIVDALKEKLATVREESVAVLGLYQNRYQANSGRIAVYGDSNCLDSSHSKMGA